MKQDFEGQPFEQPGKPLSWSEVWIRALTKPSVAAYETILKDPNASTQRALTWIFICFFVGSIILMVLGSVLSGVGGFFSYEEYMPAMDSGSLLISLCFTPFLAAFAVAGFAISAALIQLGAKILGGDGSYSDFLYLYAAIYAPISLISLTLSSIPFLNFCLSIPLSIYTMVLTIISVNATHKFGWGKSIAAFFVVPLILGFTLGPESVAGLLAGALLTGFLLAVMMANSGGAWDNAKKYIESGAYGGKGSEAHKAAVCGDTVGDPFKDTAGPSLNILIKLVGKVAVIFGPAFAVYITL